MPPARRVSGSMVIPCRVTGRRWTRGSPVGGAPTSSSSGTPWARASGSSSSRVGPAAPDSSRDRVLTEMPVAADRSASVMSRCRRRARSRGPTAGEHLVQVVRPLLSSLPDRQQTLPHPAAARAGWRAGGRHEHDYDVVVVGGGAAGLSGALMLGRSRRSVLVVDAGEPRNAPAERRAQLLGRDGTPPGRAAGRGRAEVAGVRRRGRRRRVRRGRAPDGDRFAVRRSPAAGRCAAAGCWSPPGWSTSCPTSPGCAERWGRDVLHCPYCHGWEVRDQAIGVLATGPMAVHQALLFRQLSDDVVLFLHTGADARRRAGRAAGRARHPGRRRRGRRARGDRRPAAGVRLADGEVRRPRGAGRGAAVRRAAPTCSQSLGLRAGRRWRSAARSSATRAGRPATGRDRGAGRLGGRQRRPT